MHLYSRFQIALSLALMLVVACAPPEPVRGSESRCAVGTRCTVAGTIYVYRGAPASVAEIQTSAGCFAAALDDRDYRDHRRWNGRKVRATGMLYDQHADTTTLSYELNGRLVAAGICPEGPVMFVETLRLEE